MMGVLLHLVCIVVAALVGCNGYINNFRFKHSNSFKGDVLPFHAIITGTYYIDILGTPELAFLKGNTQFEEVVKARSLVTSDFPVICSGKLGKALASMNGAAHKELTKKLMRIRHAVKDNDPSGLIEDMLTWNPYIDFVKHPEYKCTPLKLHPSSETDGGYTFTTTVEFNDYKPVFFIDSLGVGMFTYSRSNDLKDVGHSSGNPIRFCGGTDYTGDMYTIEPRPECPIGTSEKSRFHGRAMVTVYKPNIVSYRRNVTRCLQRVTHIHAYENIFDTARDAWRKTRNVHTTKQECMEWKNTLNACPSFSVRAIRDQDSTPVDFTFSNRDGYYEGHPDECEFVPALSQNTAAREYETKPDLKYYYSGGGTNSRDMRSGTLTNGFMEVAMPTVTMTTPWMNIPQEAKSKGYYEYNNVTLIWEPFLPDDLCLYVERFRGEVSYIKYKHGDYNIPIDPSSDEENYTLFLVAEQYGALFNVDSTNKIADTSELNCMPHMSDYRTTLYQTGSDQIIMVTIVDEGAFGKHTESHIPPDMAHMGTDEQAHGAFSSVHVDVSTGQISGIENHNAQTSRTGTTKKYDLKDQYNTVKATAAKDQPVPPTPPLQPPTTTEVLSYLNYKRAEIQRENLHVRALQSCFTNQLNWDAYTQLLDLNPSRAISNRLNMAVQASLGGNGFYNVKRCELAASVSIVPTLHTSSDERVVVNGETYAVKDIVKHLGVTPDPEKCFVMPLLVFTSPSTGIQVVGQLTLEGVINTEKMSYVEPCGKNKAFVFLVNNYGHFFMDYIKNFTETADKIRNATDRFLSASQPMVGNGQLTNNQYHELSKAHSLSKIHTLSIVQPANLKEKEYGHYPTSVYSNDIYTVSERQDFSLGILKLMEEQNFERYAAREFTAEWNQDRPSHDSGIFYGMSNFIGGSGDFFLKAGMGLGTLMHGTLAGGGELLKGAGEGVGAAGKGLFDGIGDVLSGGLGLFIGAVVAVIVLAVIGVVIYKQLTGKNNVPPPEAYDEQQQPYYASGGGATKRAGFNFG